MSETNLLLEQTNARWHECLSECYFNFLERLTALELAAAEMEYDRFRALLETHIDFEESVVDPLPFVIEIPPERRRLIAADHLILRRLLEKVAARLEAIKCSPHQRKLLVRSLNDLLRLSNVLEHHDARERQEFYPLLTEQLERQQNTQLAQAMEAAMQNVCTGPAE